MIVAFASAVSTVAVLQEASLACVWRSIVNEVSLFELSSHESDTSLALPTSVATSVEAPAGATSATMTVVQGVKPEESAPLSAAIR